MDAGAGVIDRTEIIRLAGELGLTPRVVEKDYVLGWVLAGIARDDELSRAWLFKGGTCLKKCFFETYRFSEDLDFTVTEPAQLDRDFLIARFKVLWRMALRCDRHRVTGRAPAFRCLRSEDRRQGRGGTPCLSRPDRPARRRLAAYQARSHG